MIAGWIGVDLDGTLAEYTEWKGETHIGAPIRRVPNAAMSDGAPAEELPEANSGPFCVHWGDPGNCDRECSACHHRCHTYDCDEDGCECEECRDDPPGA